MKEQPTKWDLTGALLLVFIVYGAAIVFAGMVLGAGRKALLDVGLYGLSTAVGVVIYHRCLRLGAKCYRNRQHARELKEALKEIGERKAVKLPENTVAFSRSTEGPRSKVIE